MRWRRMGDRSGTRAGGGCFEAAEADKHVSSGGRSSRALGWGMDCAVMRGYDAKLIDAGEGLRAVQAAGKKESNRQPSAGRDVVEELGSLVMFAVTCAKTLGGSMVTWVIVKLQ